MLSLFRGVWAFIRGESVSNVISWVRAVLVATFWLLLVLTVWTLYLFQPYRGWKSLYLLVRYLLDRDNEVKAEEARAWWVEDDKIINKILGGNRLNTISSRTGYNAIKYYMEKKRYIVAQQIINKIFWFDPHHCFFAINWVLYPGEQEILTEKYIRIYNPKRKLP